MSFKTTFSALPLELTSMIGTYLDPASLNHFATASKGTREAAHHLFHQTDISDYSPQKIASLEARASILSRAELTRLLPSKTLDPADPTSTKVHDLALVCLVDIIALEKAVAEKEDQNLVLFFSGLATILPAAAAYLAQIQTQPDREKASLIRSWLGSNPQQLDAVTALPFTVPQFLVFGIDFSKNPCPEAALLTRLDHSSFCVLWNAANESGHPVFIEKLVNNPLFQTFNFYHRITWFLGNTVQAVLKAHTPDEAIEKAISKNNLGALRALLSNPRIYYDGMHVAYPSLKYIYIHLGNLLHPEDHDRVEHNIRVYILSGGNKSSQPGDYVFSRGPEDEQLVCAYLKDKSYGREIHPALGDSYISGLIRARYDSILKVLASDASFKQPLISHMKNLNLTGDIIACCETNPKLKEKLKLTLKELEPNHILNGYFDKEYLEMIGSKLLKKEIDPAEIFNFEIPEWAYRPDLIQKLLVNVFFMIDAHQCDLSDPRFQAVLNACLSVAKKDFELSLLLKMIIDKYPQTSSFLLTHEEFTSKALVSFNPTYLLTLGSMLLSGEKRLTLQESVNLNGFSTFNPHDPRYLAILDSIIGSGKYYGLEVLAERHPELKAHLVKEFPERFPAYAEKSSCSVM